MKYLTLIFCISIGLIACKNNQDQLPIFGLWKLHLMEIKNTEANEWSEWRQGMTGYLLYEKSGYMALHLAPKDYPNTELVFRNFTDTMPIDQLKYISQNYNYTGSYTVDKDSSIVSHIKLSHSNPNEWGEVSRRKFSFSGDTLIIRPVEEKNARLRLKLLKVQAQKVLEH